MNGHGPLIPLLKLIHPRISVPRFNSVQSMIHYRQLSSPDLTESCLLHICLSHRGCPRVHLTFIQSPRSTIWAHLTMHFSTVGILGTLTVGGHWLWWNQWKEKLNATMSHLMHSGRAVIPFPHCILDHPNRFCPTQDLLLEKVLPA